MLQRHPTDICFTIAHIIRRMSTKLFHAVSKLSANFRWALTGTPIQNSLEDLASLVAFIRVFPLDNLTEFRKHIITPLLKNTGLGAEALRCLLDSICLRRTKKLLDLPEDKIECREVEFSAAEQELYSTTERDMISVVKQQDNNARDTKGYFGMFQVWLRLRRLCNHGTFQKPFSLISAETSDLEFEDALALTLQKGGGKCTYCNTGITALHSTGADCRDYFTVCGYLICSRCVPRYNSALRKDESKAGYICSLCLENVTRSCLFNKIGKDTINGKAPSEDYFQADGVSSKVCALVADIEQNGTETKG